MSSNKWKEIHKLLVVTKFSSIDELISWRTALKEVGLNINECTIVSEVASKKEKAVLQEMGSVVFASVSDIGFLGKIKSPELSKMFASKYDTILQVEQNSPKLMKLFKKMKFNQTIGVNTGLNEFDIELSTVHTHPQHIVNFVRNTLEKIT